MMPDWAMGYWQSKLRYESQDEVMSLAQEFHDVRMATLGIACKRS